MPGSATKIVSVVPGFAYACSKIEELESPYRPAANHRRQRACFVAVASRLIQKTLTKCSAAAFASWVSWVRAVSLKVSC